MNIEMLTEIRAERPGHQTSLKRGTLKEQQGYKFKIQ